LAQRLKNREQCSGTAKKKRRKSGAEIDPPAPAAEIQIITEKTNSNSHASCSDFGVYTQR